MEALIKIFTRDLDKLKLEVDSFEYDKNLWETKGDIQNSAGNLCLHLVGNLNHFIGNIIGGTGYVRNRKAEFENKPIDRDDLLKMIDETRQTVTSSLQKFELTKLKTIYPIQVFNEEMSYEFFLIHLATHLNYHLGQINYLRRILEA